MAYLRRALTHETGTMKRRKRARAARKPALSPSTMARSAPVGVVGVGGGGGAFCLDWVELRRCAALRSVGRRLPSLSFPLHAHTQPIA